jgi:hypothetical protein
VSTPATRRLLFLTLLLLLPLPLFAGVTTGLMPVVRMGLLAGVCVGMLLFEGTRGAVGLLLALIAAQAALYSMGLWLAAALGAGALARLPERARRIAPLALVLAAGLLAASQPIYRTPFRAAGVQATWLEVFE